LRDRNSNHYLDIDKHLLDASKHGDINDVRKFLAEGANPNVKGDSGSTPLHNAAKAGDPEAVDVLLNHGADPNATDNSGSIPLHYAAQHGHERIIQLLLTKDDVPETQKEADPEQVY
jgi:cytohesin